jgi:hypothetical protein
VSAPDAASVASRPATRAWRALESLAEEYGGVQIARGIGGCSPVGFWIVRVSTSSGEYGMESTDLGLAVEALAEQVPEWERERG